jgi:adenylate cyclase
MGLEIERRFLVQGSGWRSRVCWQARLRQGYLRSDPDGFTLRVRLSHSLASPPAFPVAGPVTETGGWVSEPDGPLPSAAPAERAWLTLKAAPPLVSPQPLSGRDQADFQRPSPADSADAGAAAAEPSRGPAAQALTRLEFEYPIPLADAEQLLALTGRRVEKCRYGLDLAGGDWVVDVFEAENAPLVVAEVELPHAAAQLSLPDWCGVEVTGWHQLSNAALAARPLGHWSARAREALLAGQPDWQGGLSAEDRD